MLTGYSFTRDQLSDDLRQLPGRAAEFFVIDGIAHITPRGIAAEHDFDRLPIGVSSLSWV